MVRLDYIACIMCGKTVILNKFRAEGFSIDPLEYYVLQHREQRGGRSKKEGEQPGFFIIEGESRNIVDLWNSADSSEREIAETLKDRLLSVVKAYMRAGIIGKEEVVP